MEIRPPCARGDARERGLSGQLIGSDSADLVWKCRLKMQPGAEDCAIEFLLGRCRESAQPRADFGGKQMEFVEPAASGAWGTCQGKRPQDGGKAVLPGCASGGTDDPLKRVGSDGGTRNGLRDVDRESAAASCVCPAV